MEKKEIRDRKRFEEKYGKTKDKEKLLKKIIGFYLEDVIRDAGQMGKEFFDCYRMMSLKTVITNDLKMAGILPLSSIKRR